MIFSIAVFIFTLLILVLIHELGHFLMAKKFNIKVEEFGFGIPPRAWGKKIGETLVSVNWLPLGGFVRLLGEDEVDKKILSDKRSFASAPVGKRIIVVVAGVAMNLLFAWLIFYFILASQNFKVQLPLIFDYKFAGVEQTTVSQIYISFVAANSPAEDAGIKSGDQVVALNDRPITDQEELISQTKKLAGEKIKLTLANQQNEKREVEVTPRKNPPENEGPLGVGLLPVKTALLDYRTPLQKIFSAPIHSWNLISYSGNILGKLISQSFVQKSLEPVSHSVAGPVGITLLANTILTSTDKPLFAYLDFIALLSLNLAVVNLLPIPALDGGRLFFLLIELVTGKKLHAQVEKLIHTIGFALLLGLTLLITFSDLKKIFPF